MVIKMEKILLTGASGFIGQELEKKLVERNSEIHEIHDIERYVTGRYDHYKDMKAEEKRVSKHYVDLKNYHIIKNLVHEISPDYIIHLAAISPVAYSYDNYLEVTEVNYLSSINLAEAARKLENFKQFIFAGTSEEYGLAILDKNKKLTENSELKPNSPYAVAKIATDMYLQYMGLAYNFPYTVIRPFNTYGRTDNNHFFIERTITQMLEGKAVKLGDSEAIRDWLYVDDHVEGYIRALGNKRAVGQTIQLSTGKGYTTKETAEIIAEMTGYTGDIEWNATQKRPLDAKVLIGDNSKAKELLGWEPKYTLEQGLEKTIAFWKESLKA